MSIIPAIRVSICNYRTWCHPLVLVFWVLVLWAFAVPWTHAEGLIFRVTVARGEDVGQCFGSLFEVTSENNSLVIGAGFQNLYNTRCRADRHALQFYLRPTATNRELEAESLPRPNNLCGTYLYGRDELVHSTYGGHKQWDASTHNWKEVEEIGGTQEVMRVADKLLEFGDSTVRYDGRTILSRPQRGSYQLFFYANGYLCFYHVDRGDRPYRAYQNDLDGFSKLYACPWTPSDSQVDLSRASVMNLPVVGETTFAWGQLRRQIVTGSNIGGFYLLEDGRWKTLRQPELKVSYQLYSTTSLYDELLMGHYPTGRLFAFDGQSVSERSAWPPVPPGVSSSAREAQTATIYGGELFVGVWPWGELWRYHPDLKTWSLDRRMFTHPAISDQITHPYDVENRGNAVSNQWGQRVTSLVTSGQHLFASTSAKDPCRWDAELFPFLAPDLWKSYGTVYRLHLPGHLGAKTVWTQSATTFELQCDSKRMSISQDGVLLAETSLPPGLSEQLSQAGKLRQVRWGEGIYGRFSGPKLDGSVDH